LGGTTVKRRHAFVLAAVLGAAAVAGTSAALQTTDLGVEASVSSEQEIARADRQLDRQEARVRRAAERRPPRLPAVPATPAVSPAPAAAVAAAAPAPAPAPAPAGVSSSAHGGDDDDRADELEDLADDRADAAEDLADERADALEDALDD
jgi:hypothetical protein